MPSHACSYMVTCLLINLMSRPYIDKALSRHAMNTHKAIDLQPSLEYFSIYRGN